MLMNVTKVSIYHMHIRTFGYQLNLGGPVTYQLILPLLWFGVMITFVATKKAPFSAGGTT